LELVREESERRRWDGGKGRYQKGDGKGHYDRFEKGDGKGYYDRFEKGEGKGYYDRFEKGEGKGFCDQFQKGEGKGFYDWFEKGEGKGFYGRFEKGDGKGFYDGFEKGDRKGHYVCVEKGKGYSYADLDPRRDLDSAYDAPPRYERRKGTAYGKGEYGGRGYPRRCECCKGGYDCYDEYCDWGPPEFAYRRGLEVA